MNIWKTITIGGKITKKDFEKKGMHVSDWANEILQKVTFSKKKEKVDLALLSLEDLGLNSPSTRKQIYDAALKLGYELCPAEVAVHLRMHYTDQPNGEWILCGMEPISDSYRNLKLFSVARNDDGKLWLYSSYGRPDDIWDDYVQWLFRVPRKYSSKKLDPKNSSETLNLDGSEITIQGISYKLKKI